MTATDLGVMEVERRAVVSRTGRWTSVKPGSTAASLEPARGEERRLIDLPTG
ncbi:MAG: hypothetical protein H6Q86_2994, partial [candidate division NC10 bacterium]|nr:hypothetical protein [candidate division NC10 bacterium]